MMHAKLHLRFQNFPGGGMLLDAFSANIYTHPWAGQVTLKGLATPLRFEPCY